HRDALEHLPDDHLDVLVVDTDTLRPVDLLDLAHQVQLHLARAHDAQHVVRVHRTGDELLAHLDLLPVGDEQPGATQDRVLGLVRAAVGRDDDAPRAALRAVGLLDAHLAGRLADRRDTLRYPGLEQLGDSRQTVGDVLTGDTTGVERPHGQLRTGFADRL